MVRKTRLNFARKFICATASALSNFCLFIAAGNFLAPAEKLSANAFKTVVDIDLLGTFNMIKASFPHLKKSKGVVINITATLQYAGYFKTVKIELMNFSFSTPWQSHAAAAKAGIDSLTKTLAVEWGKYGIRVNGLGTV